VRFVWDEAKNRANKAKHGVSFELTQLVFDDPLHLNGEEIIRLVSARKATRRERALYEEGQGIG
jgi:uncharacterized DUF497 family protein